MDLNLIVLSGKVLKVEHHARYWKKVYLSSDMTEWNIVIIEVEVGTPIEVGDRVFMSGQASSIRMTGDVNVVSRREEEL